MVARRRNRTFNEYSGNYYRGYYYSSRQRRASQQQHLEKFLKVLTAILSDMAAINGISNSGPAPGGKFYTYILCGLNDWHYCGITNNIVRRYFEHNSGMSRSTRSHAPYILKWIHVSETRQQARFLEVKIKRAGVRKWMQRNLYSSHHNSTLLQLGNISHLFHPQLTAARGRNI